MLMVINSFIHRGLVQAGHLIAENARNRTTSGYPSARKDEYGREGKGVSNSITLGKVQQITGDIQEIEISISTKDEPTAVAYELGSGIHSTEGQKSAYPIKPRKSIYLAFQWINEPKVITELAPHLNDGRVLLKSVQHPGVEAKPYLKPALDDEMPVILGILGDEVLSGISLEIGSDEIILE